MDRNERNVKRRKEDERANRRATPGESAEQPHRLRGGEFAKDFVDADADSCVASHRRNDKESES